MLLRSARQRTGGSGASALLLAVALLLTSLPPAWGRQAEAPPPAPPDIASLVRDILPRLTEGERSSFESALAALPEVDEARRPAVRDLLTSILADLKTIEAALAKIADLDQRVANAPILLEQIRAELAQPPPAVEVPAEQSVQQLEQGLAQAEAELKAAREEALALENEAQSRTRLREEIPGVIARTRQEIQSVADEIASRTTLGALDPASRSELLRLMVRRRSLEQTVASLEKEQASIEARRESLRARQDRAARLVTQSERRVEAWRQRLNEAREAEARRIASDAKRALRQAANEHEVIKARLEERTELAAHHEQLVSRHQQAQKDRQAVESSLASVRAQFLRSFEEIQRAGLTNTVGIILGSRRGELPSVRFHQQQIRRRQQQLSEALGSQFEFERRRDEIKDIGAAVERIVAALGPEVPAEEREAIKERATEELRVSSGLLGQIIETTRDLSDELSEADAAERDLVRVTQDYAAFIDEHILWIRSASPLDWSDVPAAAASLARFGDQGLWAQVYGSMRESVVRDPVRFVGLLVPVAAWILLLVSAPRLKRARARLGEELDRDRLHPSFRPTFKAMGLLLLESLRWPLLLLIVSMAFAANAQGPAEMQSMVEALRSASLVWLALEVGRQACRGGGFAEVHLRWPREAVAAVRRSLFWLICFVVPAEALFRVVNSEGHSLASEPLARLTFILGMIVLALFVQRILRPHGPVLRTYFDPIRGGWLARLSVLWFLLLLGLPIFLAVLTGLGYFYSAQRLQEGLARTFLLGLLMVIGSAFFYRWLWVARRRVAIEQALKRRAAAQEQAQSGGADGETSSISEDEIDLPAANAQTVQLFRSAAVLTALFALWGIWNDALPALGLLDQFELWPRFGPVEVVSERPPSLAVVAPATPAPEVPSGSNGSAAPSGGSGASALPGLPVGSAGPSEATGGAGADAAAAPVQRVTIADLIIAVVIGVVTLILTRNIPGLLEIAVLQRLPLDAGSRYAISTIVRYIIVIVGVAITFGAVGIGWSKIQWLAAALTFGLAFGLQEIFANFISGLIILIERPLRVGDTVTIGNISGEVARIRMRATTITEWSRKELIVPNKEFITGQLINWTLSDPTLRLEIPIGIAYGSDTRLARSLLLKVANKCEFVLKDPPPRAVFIGFGDNALNFELRFFIPHIKHFIDARDFVNFAIDDEFRKAGVEIAFPQRDIHIRTISAALPLAGVDVPEAPAHDKGAAG